MTHSEPVPIEQLLEHRAWVEALARSLVADETRAADLAQDAWLSAIRHPPRHAGALRAWLSRLVRHRASDLRRGESRRTLHEESSHEPRQPAADPSDVVARIEEHERLVRAVLSLPEPYRTAVMLRYYDSLSAAEIAERTGAPVPTVKTRLKRGLAQLRERLDTEHGGDGRAWCAALLPLAAGGGLGTKAALIQGGIAVTAKTKAALAVAAVLLLALTAAVVFRGDSHETPPATGASPPAVETADAAQRERHPKDGDAAGAAHDAMIATPRGTSIVSGTVRFVDGNRAAAGQMVSISTPGAKAIDVTTDERGVFRFEQLAELRAWRVTVAAASFAPVIVPDIRLERDESHDLGTLWLSKPARIEVTVKDWSDRPIVGAGVEVYRDPMWRITGDQWTNATIVRDVPTPAASATTDPAGRAVFDALPRGEWRVVARAPGFVPVSQRTGTSGAADEKRELLLRLDRGGRVEGLVLLADRSPAAGVVVWAGQPNVFEGAGVLPRATSDASGRFVLDAVRNGDVPLFVGRLGTPPADAALVRVPATLPVEIVLDGNVIEGRVTDAAGGAPIAGARVRVSMGNRSRIVEATSDEDGRYRLDTILAGSVSVFRVEHAGYVPFVENPWESGGFWFENGRGTRDFALRRGVLLSGRVTTPSGPAGGAQVIVNWGLKSAGLAVIPAFTDADGRFAFDGVPPGPVVLQVRAEGAYQPVLEGNWVGDLLWNRRPACATDVPEEGRTDVVISLVAGRSISGRVEWETGAPAGGASVMSGESATTSAADGSFRLSGAPPRLGVGASKGGASGTVDVPADGDAEGVVVRFTTPSHVTGRVTTPSGAPAADASIELLYAEPTRGRWTGLRVPVIDGHFDAEFRPLTGSTRIALRASAPGFAPADSPFLAIEDSRTAYSADLVLGTLRSIEGRVVSSADESVAVAGARIAILPKDWTPQPNDYAPRALAAVSSADGRFRLDAVPDGGAKIELSRDGFVREVVPVANSADPLVLRLTPALEITGIVRLADTTPIAHANVNVRRENDNRPDNWYSAQTGNDGRFRITGLPPGSFTLSASPASQSKTSVRRWEKTGVAAGTRDLDVVLETAGEIAGRVVDADGKPVPRCTVGAYSETRDPFTPSAPTQDDGTFVIRGLGTGTYALITQPPQSPRQNNLTFAARFLATKVTGVAVGAKDVEIRLPEGATIRGVIANSSGAPLGGTWVRADLLAGQTFDPWLGGVGRGIGAQADAAGAFAITGLLPGRYRLVHVPDPNVYGDGFPVKGGDDVASGASGLRLITGGVATISGRVVDELGAPMAKVGVRATPVGGGPTASARTDETGAFTIKDASDLVRYAVIASKSGLVPASADDVAPGAAGLVLRLVAGLEASGRVLQKDGTPFAKQSVQLSLEGGDFRVSASTDADGRFTAKALKPGTYRVEEVLTSIRYGERRTPRPCGTIQAGQRDAEMRMPE